MSVGIKRDVFDDFVCYDFWSGELARAHVDTAELIRYVQSLPGERETYCELLEMQKRWAKRDSESKRAR
jgi:hypothetical protein